MLSVLRRCSARLAAVIIAVTVIGAAGVASAADDAPVADDLPVAVVPEQVTAVQLDQVAAMLGHAEARSPSGAWVSECLTGRGVGSSYDDRTGEFTVDGDGPEFLDCLRQLAAQVDGG